MKTPHLQVLFRLRSNVCAVVWTVVRERRLSRMIMIARLRRFDKSRDLYSSSLSGQLQSDTEREKFKGKNHQTMKTGPSFSV